MLARSLALLACLLDARGVGLQGALLALTKGPLLRGVWCNEFLFPRFGLYDAGRGFRVRGGLILGYWLAGWWYVNG